MRLSQIVEKKGRGLRVQTEEGVRITEQLKRSNKERGRIVEKCNWTQTNRRERLADSTEVSKK